jgi:NAD-dependent histone deacetylase SIR2
MSTIRRKERKKKIVINKRFIDIGRLRPKILLYEEINPNNIKFGAIFLRDLRKGPDIVIIIGISLKIPEARRLTKEFCRAIKIRKRGVII